MGLFDQDPEKMQAELEAERQALRGKWILVISLVFVAFLYKFATPDSPYARLDIGFRIGGALGFATGSLCFPGFVTLIVARFTKQWHIVFAVLWAVMMLLVVIGSSVK
jgi:di/tricarboxylate transporter